MTYIKRLILLALLTACQNDQKIRRVDPEVTTQIYATLEMIDSLFSEAKISYWLAYGSLLGAVRHGGIIPWDDDADLILFERKTKALKQLEPELNKRGYQLVEKDFVHGGGSYFKICRKEGPRACDESGNPYPWTYPFVDLFPMREEGNIVYRTNFGRLRCLEQGNFFMREDLELAKRTSFGRLSLPIPNNSKKYLMHIYGPNVFKRAVWCYDHQKEQREKRKEGRLVTKSCAPDLNQ